MKIIKVIIDQNVLYLFRKFSTQSNCFSVLCQSTPPYECNIYCMGKYLFVTLFNSNSSSGREEKHGDMYDLHITLVYFRPFLCATIAHNLLPWVWTLNIII